MPAVEATRASVSVVIPTLNEAKNIPWVLRRMPSYVDEVVIVDGRSTDNTVGVAQAIRDNLVIVNEQRKGKGVALRSGFAAASGDIIVMLDADGSMDPQEIGWVVSRFNTITTSSRAHATSPGVAPKTSPACGRPATVH